jgi:hypothetical protein
VLFNRNTNVAVATATFVSTFTNAAQMVSAYFPADTQLNASADYRLFLYSNDTTKPVQTVTSPAPV